MDEYSRRIKVGALSSGVTSDFLIDVDIAEKWGRFKYIECINTSTENIDLLLDGEDNRGRMVSAGKGVILDFMTFSNVKVKNLDGANATSDNEVQFIYSNITPSRDEPKILKSGFTVTKDGGLLLN